MTLETRPFDAARYLDSPEAVVEYLEAAFETGDAAFIVNAFGVAARARGMTQIARDASLSRESLYRALGDGGNPEFGTVLKVAKALGLRIGVSEAAKWPSPGPPPLAGMSEAGPDDDAGDIDRDRIDDAVLALMQLGRWDGDRTWKGFDWDALDRLHAKGMISDPKSKAKSVVLTEEGQARSQALFAQLFTKASEG